MTSNVVVFNNYHSVGVQVGAWMMKQLGYRVFAAGRSFHKKLHVLGSQEYRWPYVNSIEGVMEWDQMPSDALVMDAYPQSEAPLREAGFKGPFLIYWGWPSGADWVEKHFRPGPRVAALAFNRKLWMAIRDRNLCPSEFTWRPYHKVVPLPPRKKPFEKFLITVVQKAAKWTDIRVLEALHKNSETRLELYGGGPPDWAPKIPHAQLLDRLSRATAMFHSKPIDSPGNAWVEACLMGVPVIVPPDFLKNTGFDHIFIDKDTCLVARTTDEVISAFRRLSDPDQNGRFTYALRKRYLREAEWHVIKGKVERLLREI